MQEDVAAGRLDPSALDSVARAAGQVQAAATQGATAARGSQVGAQAGAGAALALSNPWVLGGLAVAAYLFLFRRRR